jgi:Ricin-type beta-trefoil lectin domain-like
MKRSMFVLASLVYCFPAHAEKLRNPIPPAQAVRSGKPVALSNNDKKSVGCIGVDKASTQPKRPVLRFPCVLPTSKHKNNQYWFLKPTKAGNENEGYFTIVNWKSDKCLGVNGGSSDPDTILLQFDCDNRANQKWRWTTIKRGNRTALSIQNYNRLCIGVHKRAVGGQGDLPGGQELVQEPCSATPDQDWRAIPFRS